MKPSLGSKRARGGGLAPALKERPQGVDGRLGHTLGEQLGAHAVAADLVELVYGHEHRALPLGHPGGGDDGA